MKIKLYADDVMNNWNSLEVFLFYFRLKMTKEGLSFIYGGLLLRDVSFFRRRLLESDHNAL